METVSSSRNEIVVFQLSNSFSTPSNCVKRMFSSTEQEWSAQSLAGVGSAANAV